MPRLFIFDMDDVLYGYDRRRRIAELATLVGLAPDELHRRWWRNPAGEILAEAGHYATADAYHAAFVAAIGADISVDAWVANRRAAMTPWPASIAAAQHAAARGQVTLLTNNGALLAAHLPVIARELAPIFGDHLRTSSDYGARKPEPRVFERVLAAYGVAPADAFFVDDNPEFVAGAARVGITAHAFTTADALIAAIDAW